ncbi:MAG: helix-turn-helix domain-containing protein [Acidimicrobiia bacterium]
MHRLLTAREVAAALRVSTMTVYRMVDAGALHAVRVGRQLRISAASFDQYLAQHTTPGRRA